MKSLKILFNVFLLLVMATSVYAETPILNVGTSECPAVSFTNRIFSSCSIDDGLCNDGESFIFHKDCNFGEQDLLTGTIFYHMWFLRLVLIVSIFLYIKKNRAFPLTIITLIALMSLNGAFGHIVFF